MVNKFKLKNPPGSDACKQSVLGRLCYAADEDGNLPPEKVLIDNLRFFLFAGYDTTKGTLGAVTFFLAQHPDVYTMLVKEVLSFKEPLDVDELKNAPILNAVLTETWRLAAPLCGHGTCATTELRYKDYVFPKGTILSSAIHGYKASEDVYSNASQFAIARWLPPDHKLHNPAIYKDIDYNSMTPKFRSFNMGPHMCLGFHFAKLEVRVVMPGFSKTTTLRFAVLK